MWQRICPDAGIALLERYLFADPDWQPEYTQVAWDDGRIVSSVHICRRRVAFREGALTMGGVTNAATLPEYRRRGINTACFNAAVDIMAADAMDFSLVFTDQPAFFARALFEEVPLAEVTGRLATTAAASGCRAAEGRDLQELAAIYTAYNSGRPIAVWRNEDYWRNWLGFDHAPAEFHCCLDDAGQIRAYCRFTAGPETGVEVQEFGCRRGEDEAAVARELFLAAAEGLPSGCPVRLRVAPTPGVLRAAGVLLCNRQTHIVRRAMARLLNAESTFAGLMAGWNDRWLEAGSPRGVLWLALPGGPFRLDAGGRLLRLERAALPEGVRGINQTGMFQLLFGAVEGLEMLSNDEAALAAVLFPPEDCVIWMMDGF